VEHSTHTGGKDQNFWVGAAEQPPLVGEGGPGAKIAKKFPIEDPEKGGNGLPMA